MQNCPMVLSEDDVRKVLRMEDLIPTMADALRDVSAGVVLQPLRSVLPVSEYGGFFGVMPACGRALGAKLVTFYPQNKDVPTHHAMILLFRPETGEPLAVLDGRLITEMRTAAVSAVATKLLARADAHVLTILGSGVQARSHLEAVRLVQEFRQVRVWSPHNAERFAPGAHINAVGATRPNWRELDDEILQRATIYVESREAALKESGDVIAAGKAIVEIGEVIAGQQSARRSADEITLFKSVGVAAEDVAAADLVYQKRAERVLQ